MAVHIQVGLVALLMAIPLFAHVARGQDAPPAGWLQAMPAPELTSNLLLARKIEARCRSLRLRSAAEDIIKERAAELSGYLYERKFGPSAASQPAVSAFEEKHQTTYDGTNSLCRAGYVEMTEGTDIGRLLKAK